MSRQIETEEQYQKSLKWLTTESERLEQLEIHDPLLKPEDKAKMMKNYDFVANGIKSYQRAQLAKEFPGLRAIYAELGWSVNPPEAEAVPEPNKASNADFLD